MCRKACVLKAELSRAFKSPKFFLTLGAVSLLLLMTFIMTYRHIPGKSYIDHWYYIYLQSYYTYLIPLLVCLPFADSMVLDRKEGFIRAILSHSKYGAYAWAKVFANGLAGALAVSLPLALSYVLLSISNKNPLNNPALNVFYMRPQEGFLGLLFREHPDTFFLVIIAAVIVMGFLWATLGLSVSLVIKNRYVAMGFPFLFSGILQYFVERARRLPWYLAPTESLFRLNFSNNQIMTLSDLRLVLILPSLLLVSSILLWSIFGRRSVLVSDRSLRESIPVVHALDGGQEPVPPVKTKPLPVLHVDKKHTRFRGWLMYFWLQLSLLLKPYMLIGFLLITVAVVVLFGKIMLNTSEINVGVHPDAITLPPVTAWDVYFSAIGNAFSMGFVFVPVFLFIVSNLQPERAYGQMAGIRIGSRRRILTTKLLLLILLSFVYLLFVAILVLLIAGLGFGFTLTPSWSQIAFGTPENINMISQWVKKYTMLEAFFRLNLMLFLGFFSLSLLVLVINSLSNRRLLGFFAVSLLVLLSFALAFVLENVSGWISVLPVIRNLVLPMYPWPWRLSDTTALSILYWVVWIALLLPISIRILSRQEFYAIAETE